MELLKIFLIILKCECYFLMWLVIAKVFICHCQVFQIFILKMLIILIGPNLNFFQSITAFIILPLNQFILAPHSQALYLSHWNKKEQIFVSNPQLYNSSTVLYIFIGRVDLSRPFQVNSEVKLQLIICLFLVYF